MKSLITRAGRSLRQKGFRTTWQNAISILGDRWFEFRYRVRTEERIKIEDMQVESESRRCGEGYAATRAVPFRKLMAQLDLPPSSVLVDFGCGRGKVLLLALEYGFPKVVGVEYSEPLCKDSCSNLNAFKMRTGKGFTSEVFCADASLYKVRSDENVFFFFNPFDRQILEKVLENIHRSQEESPRDIWLIYNNPISGKIGNSFRNMRLVKEYSYGSSKFVVYYCSGMGAAKNRASASKVVAEAIK